MALGVAGFAVASTSEEQIAIDDILADKVIYLTSNMKLFELLLQTDEKINLFERLVDLSGLEHLIPLRCIQEDATYKHYW